MEIIASILIIVAMITSFHPLAERPNDEIIIQAGAPGIEQAVHYQRVKPFIDLKNANVVRQQYDYSCGSASLATILNYYLGEELTEEEVVNGLFAYGNRDEIERRRAFSLLDMKRFVSALGYNVAGYTADIDDLKSLGMPCIIPIDVFQYKHFVVFRGIYKDHIFFADPFIGNTSYTLTKFKDIWYRNIVFLVSNGGNELDTLMLTDEDLRIVSFDMERDFFESYGPISPLMNEKELLESTGKTFFLKEY